MASIKDVAKHANVGIATVSRVINNSGFVSKETRALVLKSIDELGYVPNQLARNFQKKQTNIIGVIIPKITQKFTAELVSQLEQDLSDLGYFIFLGSTQHNLAKELEYLEKLKSQQVAGFIITAPFMNDSVSQKYQNLPIVSYDRIISDTIPCVHVDNYQAGVLLSEKLVSKSQKKMAFVGLGADQDSLSQQRLDAFIDTATKHKKEYLIFDALNENSNREYLEHVYTNAKDCDAYFCASDHHAQILINIIKNDNKIINQDVFVVGFDGLAENQLFRPLLTTIEQPMSLISKCLIETLMKKINESEVPNNIEIPFNFIEGETCK